MPMNFGGVIGDMNRMENRNLAFLEAFIEKRLPGMTHSIVDSIGLLGVKEVPKTSQGFPKERGFPKKFFIASVSLHLKK